MLCKSETLLFEELIFRHDKFGVILAHSYRIVTRVRREAKPLRL